MKTKQSDSGAVEKNAHIPPPPGGGSWRWDEAKCAWFSLDAPAPTQAATSGNPAQDSTAIQTTEE